MLSFDPALERPKDASYESLLIRAASQVDSRFAEQPEAAARIHWLLGRRFHDVGQVDAARGEYEKAAALLPRLRGSQALPALLSIDRAIPLYVERGEIKKGIDLSRKLLSIWEREFGANELSTLLLRTRAARLYDQAGEIKSADAEFRSILAALPAAPPPSNEMRVLLKDLLGWIIAVDTSALSTDEQISQVSRAFVTSTYAGHLSEFNEDHLEAVAKYRDALPMLYTLLGNDNEAIAVVNFSLGVALAMAGHYEEGSGYIDAGEKVLDNTLPPQHWLRVLPRFARGKLELERGSATEASAALTAALNLCGNGCSPRLAEEIHHDLAKAYDDLGLADQSINAYRRTVQRFDLLRGPNHIGSVKRRLGLADALRRNGNPKEAAAVLAQIAPTALDELPRPHLVIASYNRIKGLLTLKTDRDHGLGLLEDSLRIFEQRLGSSHSATKRVRAELAAASNPD
jgi:tetratricopeptide (TPR) repeat protein